MFSNTFLSPSPPSTCSSKHRAWLHLCCTTRPFPVPRSVARDSRSVECWDDGRKLHVTEHLNQIVRSKGI